MFLAILVKIRCGEDEKRRGGPGEHKERREEHRISVALRGIISV